MDDSRAGCRSQSGGVIIYLTGATRWRDEPALIAAGVGLVASYAQGTSHRARVGRYGADIGMGFTEADRYAVSPDCYPDAVESLRRGMEFAGIIREMGFPVAIVAQDGAERLRWPWDEFDVLFVGGEKRARSADEWKLSGTAEGLCREARNHGKWVHMGRVNSWERIERARSMGCNSVDGTFIRFRRRQRATDPPGARDARGALELGAWVDGLARTPTLPGFTTFETPALPVHREAINRG